MTRAHMQRVGEKARAWADRTALREGFSSNLMGLCARSSAQLFTLLKQEGEYPLIAYSIRYAHFFVLVDDYVIDVTATQFHATQHSPVLILPREEAEKLYPQYIYDRILSDPQKLGIYQRTTKWASQQTTKEEDYVDTP